MDGMINFLEIVGNEYKLERESLVSTLNKANKCNSIAVISIMGQKSSGKTFFIDCLFNYINSKYKDQWPECDDAIMKLDQNQTKTKVLKISSQPFIIEEKLHNNVYTTAVYLIDSDNIFDHEMQCKCVRDISALLLLISSTVIFNCREELTREEVVGLRDLCSNNNCSLNSMISLQNIVFLLRDWKPENSKIKLRYGSQNGSKYIQNLTKSMNFDEEINNLNNYCYLMSEPNFKTDLIEVNLRELGKQFISDLKNLIPSKLLDTDELQRMFKDKSNECINVEDLLRLIETGVEKLNEQKENICQSEEESKHINSEQESTIIREGYPKPLSKKKFNSSQDDENIGSTEQSTRVNNHKTEGKVLSTTFEQVTYDDIRVQLEHQNYESKLNISNSEKSQLITEAENENELNFVQTDKNINDVHKENETMDKEIANKDQEICTEKTYEFLRKDKIGESISLGKLPMPNQMCEQKIESSDMSSSNNFIVSEKISFQNFNLWQKFRDENSLQNSSSSSSNIPLEENELSSIKSDESLYYDCETFNSHIHRACDNVNEQQSKIDEFDDEDKKRIIESEIRVKLSEIVDSLIVQYKNKLGFELDNNITDFDSGINQYHEKFSKETIRNFKIEIKSIEEQVIVKKLYEEYEKLMLAKIDDCFKSYDNDFKNTINNYQELLAQSSRFFEQEIESSLKSHIIGNFNSGLNGVRDIDKIFDECKEKSFNSFKNESEKFGKTSIEKLYLKKLDDIIMKDKIKFQNILSYFFNNQKRRKDKFPNQIYISETELKNFHDNEKVIILNQIKMLSHSKVYGYVESIMNTVFEAFEEQNKMIGKCELEVALNANDLSYELYCECFKAKLRSGLFTPTQVDCIHLKIFAFTIKSLLETCKFNRDQKYLVDECKTELKMKAEDFYLQLSSEYQKKFDSTIKLLNKVKTNAINTYCSEMNAKLIERHLNFNEFTDFHHKISRKAMELFNNSTQYFEQQFDDEFAKKLILETRSTIRNNINRERNYFEGQNRDNSAKGVTLAVYLGQQYITAAIYRNEMLIILDKFGQKLRPNSIAIENGIIFGSEAKNYLEKTYQNITAFESFDIKRLLGRKRKTISHEELKSFPFNFVENGLSVHVNYDDLMLEMNIETILALLILDLKSEAEKQTGEVVQHIMLTYPTSYNLIKKNAIRNVTKIAGFERDFDVISEISAAAIGYVTDKCEIMSIDSKYKVLFVVINDFECDVAVCEITQNKIKYKSYFNGTLNPNDSLYKKILSKVSFDKVKSKLSKNIEKFKMKMLFKYMLEIVLKSAKYKSDVINDWIIAGHSLLVPNIKHWIQKYFCSKSSSISNPIDIIINGCTIYGEMLAKRKEYIEISEVATYDISFNFQTKTSPKRIFEVLRKNEPLSKEILFPYIDNIPRTYDLPINISVFQGRERVSIHSIDNIEKLYERSEVWLKHDLLFIVDYFGDIELMSLITNKSEDLQIYLNFNVIKSGLSDVDIIAEKEKIFLLKQKINEKLNKVKEISLAENSANYFINFCLTAKTEVENNRDIRPMIKKEILKELEETLKFVENNRQDLVAINNRKQILIKELETYKLNTDLIKSLLCEH